MNDKLLNKKSIALEIKNLTKIVRNRKILDEVSFSVPKGSITIFVGENGAGKSTTIKCILDLFYYNSGEIKILVLIRKTHFHAKMLVMFLKKKISLKILLKISYYNMVNYVINHLLI